MSEQKKTDAFTLALRAIGRKERTVTELEAWLEAREVDAAEIADVRDRLISAGALDDAGYARRFTEDKRSLSGWGNERIREGLSSRGIAKHLIEAAVADQEGESEADRALLALESRPFDLSDDRGRGRALGFLVRRGFSYENAYEAIRQGLPR